jgi:predicted ester cyclase
MRAVGPQQNKFIVHGFYDQWNSEPLTSSVWFTQTLRTINRDPEIGLEKFRHAIEGVMGAVPDSSWTTLKLIAEEDLVVCHNRWSGSYGGEVFRGIPATRGKLSTSLPIT